MAETLKFTISADDNGTPKILAFKKSLEKMGTASDKVSASLDFAKKAMLALGAAVAVNKIAQYSKSMIDAMDETSKLAASIGVGTKELTSLQYAAGLAGVETDTLRTSMTKFTKAIGEARSGSESAKLTFNALQKVTGVDLVKSNLNAGDALGAVADAFQKIKDPAQRVKLSLDLFGKSGLGMVNVLKDGSKALAEMQKEASDLGVAFSDDAGKNAELFNDELERMQGILSGVLRKEIISVMPEVINLLTGMRMEMARTAKETQGLEKNKNWVIEFAKMAIIAYDYVEMTVRSVNAGIVALGALAMQPFQAFMNFFIKSYNLVSKLAFGKKSIPIPEMEFSSSRFQYVKEQYQAIADLQEHAGVRNLELMIMEGAAKNKSLKISQEIAKVELGNIEKPKAIAKEKIGEMQGPSKDAFEKYQSHLLEIQKRNDEAKLQLQKLNAEGNLQLQIKAVNDEASYKTSVAYEVSEEIKLIEAQRIKDIQDLERQALNDKLNMAQNVAGQFGQILGNVDQARINKVNSDYDSQKQKIISQGEQELATAGNNEKRKEAIRKKTDDKLAKLDNDKQKRVAKIEKDTARARQAIAATETIIQTAKSIVEASPNPWLMGLAAAVGATQLAVIKSQKFATGGFPEGRNALITVNEQGQEAVLNHKATATLGRGAINAANNGNFAMFNDMISGQRAKGTSFNISISGGMVDRRFVENELIPLMRKSAARL